MFTFLIAAGFLVGDYVYHRWFQDQPPPPAPSDSITLPAAQEGANIPVFYGQVRVRTPIMAWWGDSTVWSGVVFDELYGGSSLWDGVPFIYGVNMFFNVGITFDSPVVRIFNVWAGELQLVVGAVGPGPGIDSLTGNGNYERRGTAESPDNPTTFQPVSPIGGYVELLNGLPSQNLIDPTTLLSTTYSGDAMIGPYGGGPPERIPGYHGFASVFLYGYDVFNNRPWIIGPNPQPDPYSFEMGGFTLTPIYAPDPVGNPHGMIPDSVGNGNDVNPIDVVYDLFAGMFGKLGLNPTSRIDSVSFAQCAQTLYNEGHGFSMSWEQGGQTAQQLLDQIMAQIDGVYYEDPRDGLIHVRLIRPDYDPTTLPVINPSNCSSLDNFAASGWTDLPTKIQATYTNRANQYRPGSSVSINQAGAVGQDGEVRTIQLQFPGVTTQVTADNVTARELSARCRPLMKCRAMCSRVFYRTVIGDVVLVNWPEANISREVFRVAAVSRGTLEDGTIALDLIQDYFYQWRNFRPLPPTGRPLPPVGPDEE